MKTLITTIIAAVIATTSMAQAEPDYNKMKEAIVCESIYAINLVINAPDEFELYEKEVKKKEFFRDVFFSFKQDTKGKFITSQGIKLSQKVLHDPELRKEAIKYCDMVYEVNTQG